MFFLPAISVNLPILFFVEKPMLRLSDILRLQLPFVLPPRAAFVVPDLPKCPHCGSEAVITIAPPHGKTWHICGQCQTEWIP